MEAPIKAAGCWHPTPLIHGLNPNASILVSGGPASERAGLARVPGIEKGKTLKLPPPAPAKAAPDMVIKPGMAFELEPNACIGLRRINIGGTVLVTKNGVEILNELATKTLMV
jgi:Xaa-Pro dipeptidase